MSSDSQASRSSFGIESTGADHVEMLGETALVPGLTRDPREEPVGRVEHGSCVERYVVLDELGRGGMGVVYKAYDPELDRRIALKLLTVREVDEEEGVDRRDRLLREAQALAQLSHPNVVSIYDVGTFGDDVFIAMELIEGRTLRSWLERSSRTWRSKLAVLLAAGRGLAAAHLRGLVHRDFKPENVIVGDDGRVCVLDFGLARATKDAPTSHTSVSGALERASSSDQDEASNEEGERAVVDGRSSRDSLDVRSAERLLHTPLTQAGSIVGTPFYMAPEQHLGSTFDARADQFAFCVVAFEALYGRRPFRAKTRADLRRSVLRGEFDASPSAMSVPRWVRRAILKGLQTHPDDRHASMDELLTALERDPGAKWRTAALATSLPLVGAGTVYALMPAASDGREPCQGVSEAVETVWNEDAASQLRRGLLGAGRMHANATYERIGRELDLYATAWSTERRDACEATRVRGEQSTQLLDLRMACLDRSLERVSRLIEVYSRAPDPDSVDDAVEAFDALLALDHCRDTDALTAPQPLPDDPQLRESIAEEFAKLDHIFALDRAGRHAEAEPLARAAHAEAQRLDYPPLLAEAAYHLAETLNRQRRSEEAESLYRSAIESAAAARSFVTSARAWLGLMWVMGLQQERFDEAWILQHAASSAIILAGNPSDLRARLLEDLGAIALQRGEYPQARDRFADAARHYEEAAGEPDRHVARTLSQKAIAHQKMAQYELAEENLTTALELVEGTYGPDHPLVATVRNNLGVNYEKQWRFARAIPEFRRAIEIYQAQFPSNHLSIGEFTNNLGVSLTREGRLEEAELHLERAIEIFEHGLGEQHPHVGVALKNLALVLVETGAHARALETANRALAIFESRLGESHPRTAEALRHVALAHQGERDWPSARDALGRAQRIVEQSVGTDNIQVAEAMTQWGELELQANRPAEALPRLEQAVTILSANERTDISLARARFALARALHAAAPDTSRIDTLVRQATAAYESWDSKRAEQALREIETWSSQRER